MAHPKKQDMNVTTRTDSVGLIGPGGDNCLRRGLEIQQAPLPAHAQSCGSSRPGQSTDPPALDLSRSASSSSRAMIMDEGMMMISNPSEFLAGAMPNMGPPPMPAAVNLNSESFPRQNFLPEQPNWNPSGFSYSQPNNVGSYGNLPYYGYGWPYSCVPFAGYYPNVQQPHQWPMSWNPGQFGAIAAAQTSPKTYPVVPQPIYANGQPYGGLGSYQYLAACQSFNSSVGTNFQANQYWKYGSWPQQPQRFVYQSTSNTPAAGMITENGLRYPAPVPNDFYLTASKSLESNEPTVEFPPDSSAETNTSSSIEEQGSVPFRSPLPPVLTPAVCETNNGNGDTIMDVVARVFDTPRTSRSEGGHVKESEAAGVGQRRKQARPRRADGESTADDAEENADVENPKKRARHRKPNKYDDESSSGPTPYKLRSGNARVTLAKPKGRPKKAKGDNNQNASKRKKAQETSDEIAPIVPPGSLMLDNGESFDPVILHRTKQWKLNSLDGETVLHRAASLGLDDFVQCILKLGLVSSPNCVNSNGLTPLHEACAQGHEQVARILLTHGAGPNKASTTGLRPLHLVHQNGHEGLAKLLIEYGAEQVV